VLAPRQRRHVGEGDPVLGGRSKHFTQEFEVFSVTLMSETPVKRAGEILRESDSQMCRMLFAHMKAEYERFSFENAV
jgi:hypothetical protein